MVAVENHDGPAEISLEGVVVVEEIKEMRPIEGGLHEVLRMGGLAARRKMSAGGEKPAESTVNGCQNEGIRALLSRGLGAREGEG
jgi:hypothetical protein